MTTTGSICNHKFVNYKLSSSYPSMKPLSSSENWKVGHLKFGLGSNNYTKSWCSGNQDRLLSDCCDLQPLTWLEERSIINISPLDDDEDEIDENTSINHPGEQDITNPTLSHAPVEVGSQENVHDFVRYAEMRNNSCNKMRFHDQPYQHSANGYVKPNLSYTQLIFMAIETCRDRAMTVNDIYHWCELNYPYYKYVGPSWKNSLRHNLSINKSFRRMPREGQGGPGRGAYWIVDDKERMGLLDSLQRTHPFTLRQAASPQQPQQQQQSLADIPTNTVGSGGPLLRLGGQIMRANEIVGSGGGGNTSTDSPDNSLKLSNSYNSNLSNDLDVDNEPSPCSKNRRKTKHDKVRSIAEIESILHSGQHRVAVEDGISVQTTHEDRSGPHVTAADNCSGTTTVNVIVAPHHDHIYARYQHFLPPAIPSNMDYCGGGGTSGYTYNGTHDDPLEMEYLRGMGASDVIKEEPVVKDEPVLSDGAASTVAMAIDTLDEESEEPETPIPRAAVSSNRRKQAVPLSIHHHTNRPRRRRTKPLRIDECDQVAIEVLSSLQRNRLLSNLDTFYQQILGQDDRLLT